MLGGIVQLNPCLISKRNKGSVTIHRRVAISYMSSRIERHGKETENAYAAVAKPAGAREAVPTSRHAQAMRDRNDKLNEEMTKSFRRRGMRIVELSSIFEVINICISYNQLEY